MKVIETKAELKAQVAEWREQGLSVGLVPTMGYLHEGHQSLIATAANNVDRIVVSDFVNPIQFGPNEDYDNYPRDLEHDIAVASEKGAHVIFHPSVEEMYGSNHNTYVTMEKLGDTLCGAVRPIHFKGVCTVVTKLINIVEPDMAFFGQKDAQQLAIIKRMVADLDMRVQVVGCPIVREDDGLAKSSRNTYLSADEREAALCLSRAVFAGQELVENGERNAAAVKSAMRDIIDAEPLSKIDYVEIVDGVTMQPVQHIEGAILCAIAVYIGNTRLIDNFIWEA